ncbi:MAG: tautomerase family protein [Salinarimonas sp.]|nr:tautomerase family protein [Salinarimonas sp.]
MPIVTVTVLEGYDSATRTRLGKQVTDAVRAVVDAPPEAVTVIIDEVARENYLRGGEHRVPGPPRPDPAQIVHDFLTAMEARDLDRAKGFLGEGFEMVFPGDARMTTLEELVAFAGPRYRFVKKSYERFDAVPGGDIAIVYCFGTLNGEWPDGEAFSGIRFIDRFEITGGRIRRQQVWNDIAEVVAKQDKGARA